MNMDLKLLKEQFKEYLKEENKSPLTIKNYINDLCSICKTMNSKYCESYEEFKNLCLDYSKIVIELNYSNASINRKKSTLRAFIRFLYQKGYIKENFSKEILSSKRKTSQNKPEQLTQDEIIVIDRALNNELLGGKNSIELYKASRNKTMFYVILHTGLKLSEVMTLQWENVDLNNNVIIIQNRKGRYREIPINENLQQVFKGHQALIKEVKGELSPNWRSYIFFKTINDNHKKDGHISAKTVDRIITDTVQKAGITRKITAETVRQTMAYYSIVFKRVPVIELAKILGHETPKYTYNFYFNTIEHLESQ